MVWPLELATAKLLAASPIQAHVATDDTSGRRIDFALLDIAGVN
jgi:hypothetical protein